MLKNEQKRMPDIIVESSRRLYAPESRALNCSKAMAPKYKNKKNFRAFARIVLNNVKTFKL